jgi:hypothetical protein
MEVTKWLKPLRLTPTGKRRLFTAHTLNGHLSPFRAISRDVPIGRAQQAERMRRIGVLLGVSAAVGALTAKCYNITIVSARGFGP